MQSNIMTEDQKALHGAIVEIIEINKKFEDKTATYFDKMVMISHIKCALIILDKKDFDIHPETVVLLNSYQPLAKAAFGSLLSVLLTIL